MSTHEKQHHPFGPFIPRGARYLILGTFPSVKSREQDFYYGHPQNKFWKLLADVYCDECPSSLEEKKAFLERHAIALYDVIESCEIIGSSDASIRNIIPTNIECLIRGHGIETIILNGRLAETIFKRFSPSLQGHYVPSSSPAYASMSYERKLMEWKKVILGT